MCSTRDGTRAAGSLALESGNSSGRRATLGLSFQVGERQGARGRLAGSESHEGGGSNCSVWGVRRRVGQAVAAPAQQEPRARAWVGLRLPSQVGEQRVVLNVDVDPADGADAGSNTNLPVGKGRCRGTFGSARPPGSAAAAACCTAAARSIHSQLATHQSVDDHYGHVDGLAEHAHRGLVHLQSSRGPAGRQAGWWVDWAAGSGDRCRRLAMHRPASLPARCLPCRTG